MKKYFFKKSVGVVLSALLMFGTMPTSNIFADNSYLLNLAGENEYISIIESKGWYESAYVKWSALKDADSYNVYYKNVTSDEFIKIDDGLIRKYENYFVADVLGLSKGSYILKIVPVIGRNEITASEVYTEQLTIDNFVREGFAFSKNSPYQYTTGAYNQDGTLKSNADVIYITNNNKDSVTLNGDESLGKGITEILSLREKTKSTKPLAIRFLGKVEMPKDTENYMMKINTTQNVTLEGVGDDATIHGWGFTMKRACNIEVRNLGIMWYGGVGGDGDSLSLDTENKNIWIHNIDFFYGAPGKDSDQVKGDGSIDIKSKSDYITVSYCHFWDSGKANVSGGVWEAKNPDDPGAKIFITYHHNWFDHSDSRHPRCVAGSTHVYNNYYDGVAVYGIGAAVKSSVFAENNYFRNCPRPMIIATQGSDVWDSTSNKYMDKGTLSGQIGGMIKEYGNIIVGAKRYYNQLTTPDEGHIDAYTVASREEKVPDTVKALSGESTYNNFDTDSSMYAYNVDTAENAKEIVTKEAGRLNGGDLKYTFDNEKDDFNKTIIPELQNAIINYESKLISVQGLTEDNNSEETTETTTEENNTSTEEDKDEKGMVYGDTDGDKKVTINDAVLLLKKILDSSNILPTESLTNNYKKYLDVDKDTVLSAKDVSIILNKALNPDSFNMPVQSNSSEENTEATTENTENTSETTTNTEAVLTGVWNADNEIPGWLSLDGYEKNGVSSSHTVFRGTDETIASQSSRYIGAASSTITINLDSASVVKVYLAGNDNGDGKGTATAELNGTNISTYQMPGRKTTDATPFEIVTDKGGTLKITNSFSGLLYKITISGSSDNQEQSNVKKNSDITLNITNNTLESTNLTIGDNIIEVGANKSFQKKINFINQKYTIISSNTNLKPNPTYITVTKDETINISIQEIVANVIVINKDGGYVGGFETISEALSSESTVDGSILSIKPGYYKETFDVSKSVTLKKEDNSDGEVVIYSSNGPYGGSMKGIVRVSGKNVTFENLTLLNNTNSAYGNIEAVSSNGTTAAALIADGDNSVYNNCKFISVQDTLNTAHYSNGKPLLKQTYNKCAFYGATDFICGACDIDFNDCEFRFFTGSLTSKKDAYVFAPNVMAKWVVNGGCMINDENSIVENFFYARAWESNSSNSQTLDIFAMKNNLKMGTKGLMGFGSSTGGGASHSIDEFQFNVYEGADKNSPLIATSNVTGIDIFEVNKDSSVLKFKNNSALNLITGCFGKNLSNKFIENILPDIVEIGFVSEQNASENLISDINTIKIKSVYKSVESSDNEKYSLLEKFENLDNSLLGIGIISGINGEKKVRVVPYIKYDPITDSSKDVDKKNIYKFGNPVEITLNGNGETEKIITTLTNFYMYDKAVFGNSIPNGIYTSNYSDIFE